MGFLLDVERADRLGGVRCRSAVMAGLLMFTANTAPPGAAGQTFEGRRAETGAVFWLTHVAAVF